MIFIARKLRLANRRSTSKTSGHAADQNQQLTTHLGPNAHVPVPIDWLTMTTDPMLAQSAVDRLTGAAHTLIIEGPSYRQRTQPAQRVAVDPTGR